MGLFSRKHKPRRTSFILDSVKRVISRDMEKIDEDPENTTVYKPIIRCRIPMGALLCIPFSERIHWMRMSDDELRSYGIEFDGDEQEELQEQKLPALPEKPIPPKLPEPTNPKKELLSNELVKDNAPLRAHILSETKEKLEKETELEMDEPEQEESDEEEKNNEN